MIRCELAPKPDGFAEEVEVPGAAWLAKHPSHSARPKAYWTKFHSELRIAFRSLCAYGAMFEPSGTCDHFVSRDEDPSRLYDWSNYRYASGWFNSRKGNLKSSCVLDPFEVGDDWFEVDLRTLELCLTEHVPASHRERAELMLDKLGLRDDQRLIDQRASWLDRYEQRGMPFGLLSDLAPLIAAAVLKRELAHPSAHTSAQPTTIHLAGDAASSAPTVVCP